MGIVIALIAAGQGLSITALIGLLMVVGIAVSNGILLVHEANVHFNSKKGRKKRKPSCWRRGRASYRSR